jgi:hypothetical protein
MICRHASTPCRHHAARALSLVEAAASVVIATLVIVAALNTVGASKLGQHQTGDRRVGHLLAQSLMSEVLQQSYEDPDDTVLTLGGDGTERTDIRTDFDDVDDYSHWSACPPEEKDGTKLDYRAGWCRSVTVAYASTSDLTKTVAGDTGIKLITVEVTHNDAVVASLVAVRTGAAQSHQLDPREILDPEPMATEK